MTTPNERFRALAHFIELLDLALDDESVPGHLRATAASIRRTFPDAVSLKELVDSGRQGLSAETADIFQRAVIWLNDLGRCGSLPPVLRRWWIWMDRHFPTAGDIEAQRETAGHQPSFLRPPIDAWLQPS